MYSTKYPHYSYDGKYVCRKWNIEINVRKYKTFLILTTCSFFFSLFLCQVRNEWDDDSIWMAGIRIYAS